MPNTIKSGAIVGNPLNGLCERACIRTNRVFDGCVSRFSNVSLSVTLENFTAVGEPYTFRELRSSAQSSVGDLSVTAIEERKHRISLTVRTPVTVSFVTANGTLGTASGVVTTNRDVVLSIPPESIVRYSVDVTSSITGSIGSISGNVLSARCCILQIIRIIAPVDIIVPTYGYCKYPECESYPERECRESFALPIFPETE